ncbi:uncharacterized protein B0P05DRAFT_538691 [Gilbertella persicaria]|uniref:uncharacterized protein n=1 Tax=Gilbertella persicaria TaxID=101096 RepID=UPI00221EA3FB|nr:uncharacterized protein B0P05DRAFT_538691 [Gilbertella persicaria]KAI8081931.1 hypothetical protein B0P05DRAFT_538691 [Gilbertella persicaria]
MSNLQTNRTNTTWIYGAAALSVLALGSGIAYYLVEDDRKVRRRKAGRRAERNTVRVLNQYKQEAEKIESHMQQVEQDIQDTTCDDKAFKQKEYILAHSNELLLQLMEKIDTVRPLTAIMGTEADPNPFERELVAVIKSKKRSVIEYIETLFRRLDVTNGLAKREAERREGVAQEKARLEKEEADRKAEEERQREEARKEKERLAKEEQERIAQEEALRRKEEEEQRLAQETLAKEMEKEVFKEMAEEDKVVLAEEESKNKVEEELKDKTEEKLEDKTEEELKDNVKKQATTQEEMILTAMKEEAEQNDLETK